MTDLLTQGAQLVQSIRQDHLTRQVVYVRGGQSVAVQATVGKTVFRLDGDYGATIRYVSRDYLIRAEDLATLDPPQPMRGDRLLETLGGRQRTCEVLGPGGDEPDWRWSDPEGLTLRLHTREIGGAS